MQVLDFWLYQSLESNERKCLRRLFVSVANDRFNATFELRYRKVFTFLISLAFISIDGKISFPLLLAFLRLIVRPNSEHVDEN